MAVITPRLVLVCALPAVITLLTVLWTRKRRKSSSGGRFLQAEKELQQPALEAHQQTTAKESVDSSFQETDNCSPNTEPVQECNVLDSGKDFQKCSNSFSLIEAAQENCQSLNIDPKVKAVTFLNPQSEACVEPTQVEKSLPQAHSVWFESHPQSQNQNLFKENYELSPKMHVKSEESQVSTKLDPEGVSTSDLSEDHSSPVNCNTSYSESIPRRSRGSCRLSEESRDSAVGGEEDLPLSDGSVCVLLEPTSLASVADGRTDYGHDFLLPELHQQVNGESGCYNDLDEVLESPPPSIYSDGHSEGSCDSGKGGSDIQAISSSDLAQSESALLVYEFELAQELCGRLIGRQGKQVNFIKNNSNANVFIKNHPFNSRLKLCAVQGTKSEIKNALELIRKRFPLSQFPSLSLVQVNVPLTCGVMVPETLQLHLPEGVTCDVILSSMVSAGHFFVQQPTHPTYPSLNRLDTCMTTCYAQMDTPPLPHPVEVGVICACPVLEGWFRAQVVNLYENSEECDVKFVDYGGYSCVPMARLRQIRSDFMTLPFQASECYLANVKPNAG